MLRLRQTIGANLTPEQADALALALNMPRISLTDIRGLGIGTTLQAKAIADYFGANANTKLFETEVKGAEVYRSDDSGATWKLAQQYPLKGIFYSYGYYFAEMRVSPDNADLVYIYGVPVVKSSDGGKTWHHLDSLGNVHSDHHALWINPKDSKHILLGNDGGLYQSYDEGANWLHLNNMSVGQFYSVNVDLIKYVSSLSD